MVLGTNDFQLEKRYVQAMIPGQPANHTVEFIVAACDKAGNMKETNMTRIGIQFLFLGDLEGDGDVDIVDIAIAARNFGKKFGTT